MADPIYEYPDPNYVLGIDVHQYSGVVNWQKAKQAGIKFALIKAKHAYATANFFRENWIGAREAGILRGAWIWLYAQSEFYSPAGQARSLVQLLGDDPGELPVGMDYEWNRAIPKYSPSESDLWSMAQVFDTAYHRRPMVYTAPGYVEEHPLYNHRVYWKESPLWIANYETLAPVIPSPWDMYTFWQWTENGYGADYGVNIYDERAVDLDYWHGSEQALYEFASALPPGTLVRHKLNIFSDGQIKEIK